MSEPKRETTKVVIIGSGVSGLTVGSLLASKGIDFILLERRSFEYIGERQRAGNVENRAARMFTEWGLEKVLTGPPYDGRIEFRVNGKAYPFQQDLTGADAAPLACIVPQNLLVFNLIAHLKEHSADLRYEVDQLSISGADTDQPVVSYVDKDGAAHEIACDFIAGCDGFQGPSRASIPAGVLTEHTKEYGMSWLNILADVPPNVLMAISEHGYVAHYPRRNMSRIYLQCKSTDTEADWPDERIWDEYRKRTGEKDSQGGPVSDKLVFPLRSVVFEPMQYGRLFLVGDSAHIILPVAGKGMNLALFDAEAFGKGVIDHYQSGDDTALKAYSDICLPRTWTYQEYSSWVNEMLHDASLQTGKSSFDRNLALARLDRLFTSKNWARAYSELLAGLA